MPPARQPGGVGNAGLAPIFSQLPLGTAGFDDAFDFLTVLKGEEFVKASPFIPWLPVPGAGAAAVNTEVAAPKDLITAAACLGGRLAPTVATRNAWRASNPLTHRFTLSAINHQAGALKSFGALTSTFTDTEHYRKSVMEILSQQPNLSTLELTDRDLEEPSPFDTPGAPAPAGGRGGPRGGRGGQAAPQAATPPVPGPAALKWLSLARTSDLVDDGAILPMEKLLRLWTLLPGRCLDSERRDVRSLLCANAEELRSGAQSASTVATPTDARLGRSLRMLSETAVIYPLPRFRLETLSFEEVSTELSDAISYAQGSAIESARSLSRRLLYGKREYGDLCSLLAELASPEERVVQLERISVLACPGRHAQALHLRLPEINTYVCERAALITTGRNAAKAGEALFDLLVADARVAGADSVNIMDQHGDAAGGGTGTRRLSAHALQMALQSDDAFLQAAERIALQDTGTSDGRRKVLEIATGAGCVLFQQTLDRPEGLKQRSPALDALVTSAAEASSYFGQRQAADSTGAVDPLAREWEMHRSQVKLLLTGKTSKMQLINPPYGVIGLLNLTASEPYEPVPDEQLYVTESVLDALGPFVHNALVAWAGAGVAVSATGYTFLTLCQAQREYVRWIKQQGDQVQAELLPHADRIFRSALERIDLELRVVLDAAEPHKAAFGHILCFGEAYDQAIAAKKEGLKPLITIHRALPGLIAASAPRSLPGVVLASKRPREDDVVKASKEKRAKVQPDASTKAAVAKPGSKSSMAVWVGDDTLKLGADTFKVTEYGKELGLSDQTIASLCWPVLCSRQDKKAALAFCDNCDDPGHNGVNAKCHRRPEGFDLDTFLKDFGTKGKPKPKGKKKK